MSDTAGHLRSKVEGLNKLKHIAHNMRVTTHLDWMRAHP